MAQESLVLAKGFSWNEIEALSPAEPKKSPAKLTFYRDTNGWCPFCERVWIALEHKQIEYDTIKINLKDKPQWFKDIVPTALVPAIELHNNEWTAETRGSGKMMWESMDILNSLDELFPDTPRIRQASRAVILLPKTQHAN
jgi:glutathione S-transferase